MTDSNEEYYIHVYDLNDQREPVKWPWAGNRDESLSWFRANGLEPEKISGVGLRFDYEQNVLHYTQYVVDDEGRKILTDQFETSAKMSGPPPA